jgi:hypothetical protein
MIKFHHYTSNFIKPWNQDLKFQMPKFELPIFLNATFFDHHRIFFFAKVLVVSKLFLIANIFSFCTMTNNGQEGV